MLELAERGPTSRRQRDDRRGYKQQGNASKRGRYKE
jgi:hypothetical protein